MTKLNNSERNKIADVLTRLAKSKSKKIHKDSVGLLIEQLEVGNCTCDEIYRGILEASLKTPFIPQAHEVWTEIYNRRNPKEAFVKNKKQIRELAVDTARKLINSYANRFKNKTTHKEYTKERIRFTNYFGSEGEIAMNFFRESDAYYYLFKSNEPRGVTEKRLRESLADIFEENYRDKLDKAGTHTLEKNNEKN